MHRFILAAVLATAWFAPPAHAQQETRVTPLARARELGAGATVLVEGTVSVAPGVFDGGFAIQDQTAGIWVLPPADPVRLIVGQRVRVQCTLDEPNVQLDIQPAAVGPLPDREVVSTRQVRTGALAEQHEGWLVQVRGRVSGAIVDDAPWGHKVMVDDGSGPVLVFIDAESGVDVRVIQTGDTVEVTGFAGQYDDHYEVVPRTPLDLRIFAPTAPTANSGT